MTALEWFTAEHRVLEVTVRWSAESGNARYTWQLAAEMACFHEALEVLTELRLPHANDVRERLADLREGARLPAAPRPGPA